MIPVKKKFHLEHLEPRLLFSRSTPTLTTAAFFRNSTSLTAIVGQAVPEDAAVLSGGNRPTDGILFKLYAPNGNLVTTQWVDVHGNGTYRTSSTVIARQVGTYTWHARYYGDGRNNSVNDQGGAAEKLNVLAVPPPPPVVPPPVTPPPVVTTKPIGYQTFYTTAAQDKALPSKQAYFRYDWAQIEPAFGVYNFSRSKPTSLRRKPRASSSTSASCLMKTAAEDPSLSRMPACRGALFRLTAPRPTNPT